MLDRETLADVTVNAVSLAVLVGFGAVLLVASPWGFDPRASTAALALVAATSLGLVGVTYLVARTVANAE